MHTAICFSSPKIHASRELPLPQIVANRINDRKAIELEFLNSGQAIFITSSSLWIWNLANRSARRIELTHDEDHLDGIFTDRESEIWVTSRKSIYLVRIKPFSTKRFDSSKLADTIGVSFSDTGIYWVRKGHLTRIGRDLSIHEHSLPEMPQAVTQGFYHTSTNTLYYVTPNEVFKRSVSNSDADESLVSSAATSIRGMVAATDSYFVYSPYNVMRMRGDFVMQTIPVVSSRKLVHMTIRNGLHAFLFSDKLVEVRDTDSEQTRYFKLHLGHIKQARSFRVLKNLVGLIGDGNPRVFQLENVRNDA